jgi:hypothetical protein
MTTLKELHQKYPHLDDMKTYYQDYEKADLQQKNIMDCDGSEYLPWTAYLVEIFFLLGNKLKPQKDCSSCDIHNDYICFDCEMDQVKYSDWKNKLQDHSSLEDN